MNVLSFRKFSQLKAEMQEVYGTAKVIILLYSPFHKTLPKSSLQMHWISVRFYEMRDILIKYH